MTTCLSRMICHDKDDAWKPKKVCNQLQTRLKAVPLIAMIAVAQWDNAGA